MKSGASEYRPDIDGLRAVSILLVLVFHAWERILPGGFVGVDVFFVISGYLITRQIIQQFRESRFSISDFYARRIRRIFPPLLVVLGCVAMYAALQLSLEGMTSVLRHIAAGSAFISNFILWSEAGYFDRQAELKPLLHLWSLAIEEQFYLVWPFVIVAALRKGEFGLGRLLKLLAVIVVGSWGAGFFLTSRDPVAGFYSPLSRFWELGLGGLIATGELSGSRGLGTQSLLRRSAWSGIGMAMIVGASILFSGKDPFPGWRALIPSCGAFLIITAGPSARLNQLLSTWPFVQFGLISYALYLWHWPLLSFLRIERGSHASFEMVSAVLALSVVLAILTRLLVEKPSRNWRARWIPPALVGLLFAFGGSSWGVARGGWIPERLQLQAEIRAAAREIPSGMSSSDCSGVLDSGSRAFRFCRIWGKEFSGPWMAVWGDSLSNSWMTAVLEMARVKQRPVLQILHAGCPAIAGVRRTNDSFAREWCNDGTLQPEVLALLERLRPRWIFLISRWNLYVNGHIQDGVLVEHSFITDAPGKADSQTAYQAFERHLPETVRRLEAVGSVIVFRESPVLRVPMDIGVTHRAGDFEPSVEEHRKFNASADRVLDRISRTSKSVMLFDPALRLCSGQKCGAFLEGVPAYTDEVHLTPRAVQMMAGDLQALGEDL